MTQEQEFRSVCGDWLISEDPTPVYTRDSVDVTNDGSPDEDIVLESGHPMDGDAICEASGISGCDGLVLNRTIIPSGETVAVAVLRRGHATINRDALPTVDYKDASITMATWQTALEGLGFVVRREPTSTIEQTT